MVNTIMRIAFAILMVVETVAFIYLVKLFKDAGRGNDG